MAPGVLVVGFVVAFDVDGPESDHIRLDQIGTSLLRRARKAKRASDGQQHHQQRAISIPDRLLFHANQQH